MSNSRLSDLLDLNEVQRWNSRVRLLRRQTVAEHTFNVMAIAYEIVVRLDTGGDPQAVTVDGRHRMLYRVLRWALVHDGPECETGDVNYLFKRHLDRQEIDKLELESCPWYGTETLEIPDWARAIVKIADKVEEYLFITKWCPEPDKWIPGILRQIVTHVARAHTAYGWRNLVPVVGGMVGVPLNTLLEGKVDTDAGHLDQNVSRE